MRRLSAVAGSRADGGGVEEDAADVDQIEAKKDRTKKSGGVQLIGSAEALQKLVGHRYLHQGEWFDISHLAVGSTVCFACRKEALTDYAAQVL